MSDNILFHYFQKSVMYILWNCSSYTALITRHIRPPHTTKRHARPSSPQPSNSRSDLPPKPGRHSPLSSSPATPLCGSTTECCPSHRHTPPSDESRGNPSVLIRFRIWWWRRDAGCHTRRFFCLCPWRSRCYHPGRIGILWRCRCGLSCCSLAAIGCGCPTTWPFSRSNRSRAGLCRGSNTPSLRCLCARWNAVTPSSISRGRRLGWFCLWCRKLTWSPPGSGIYPICPQFRYSSPYH